MPTRPSDVEAVAWQDFLRRMRDTWEPGQHVALVGPTGERKTTFGAGICRTRRYVLALDQKGGDKTLGRLGWERRTKWPLNRRDMAAVARGEPVRRIMGSTRRDQAARTARRQLHREVLRGVMEQPGWTVLASDLKALTARQFGDAWDEVVELLILARDAGTSLVTDFHGPRGVPPEVSENATFLGISYMRDMETVSDLAQWMGRMPAEIRGAVDGLAKLPGSWIWVSRDPRAPIVVTVPEKL